MANMQFENGPDAPATSLQAIAPADVDIVFASGGTCKALYIGGAGTLVVTAINDAAPVSIAVGAGSIIPVKAKRVGAATTATGIIALIG